MKSCNVNEGKKKMKLVVFGHGRLDISAMSGPSMLEI